MIPKSPPNQFRIYDFDEDIHKFFSKFSILNLCSEMYFLREQFMVAD